MSKDYYLDERRREGPLLATRHPKMTCRIVVVETEGVETPRSKDAYGKDKSDRGMHEYSLKRWFARSYLWRADVKLAKVNVGHGRTAKSWWHWVDQFVSDKGMVLIVGSDLSKTLPLLDIYNEVVVDGIVSWRVDYWMPGKIPVVELHTIPDAETKLKKIRFHDSKRIWDLDVDELAEKLGMDYTGTAKNKCNILARGIEHWRRIVGENYLGSTMTGYIGAQAMACFKYICEKDSIYIHNQIPVLKHERKSYHGGYMIARKCGELYPELHSVDMNSAYLWAMLENMPRKLGTSFQKLEYDRLFRFIEEDGDCVVAEVELVSHEPHLLHVCRRHPPHKEPDWEAQNDADRERCAEGHYAVLTTPELLYVRDLVMDVGNVSVYHGGDVFAKWAQKLWKLRKKADPGTLEHYMYKRLSTALHGKFSQRPTYWKELETAEECGEDNTEWEGRDPATGEPARFRQMLGLVEMEVKKDESRESCPAIAAHITAYARMRLMELIDIVGMENVYYCDTDGLLINDDGLARIPAEWFGNRMGELKYELLRNVKIWGVKRYRADNALKMASYSRRGRPEDDMWVWDEWSQWWPYTIEEDSLAYARRYRVHMPETLFEKKLNQLL